MIYSIPQWLARQVVFGFQFRNRFVTQREWSTQEQWLRENSLRAWPIEQESYTEIFERVGRQLEEIFGK